MARVVLGRKAEDNGKCPLGLVEKEEQWTSTGPMAGSSTTPKSSVQNTSTIQMVSQNHPLDFPGILCELRGLSLRTLSYTWV